MDLTRIQQLTPQLASQIAAGEVVDRPASVVKELVENSLDAGAENIIIQLDHGGIYGIKITDDGSGILQEDLPLALARHATSKIKTSQDLSAINSLGFRGEALASMASVSRLTLTSHPKSQEEAYSINVEGKEMTPSVSPAAHPEGTTVLVEDLFYNTPARRKFLKTEKTEFYRIEEMVRQLSLCYMEVALTLIHNGKTIFQFPKADSDISVTKRIQGILGKGFFEHATYFERELTGIKVTGWVGDSQFTRNQNDRQYFYVNNRMVKDKVLQHAVRQAYDGLLPPGRYPVFLIDLTLEPKSVDVNVHPTKAEVRFRDSRLIHDFIFDVLHGCLHNNEPVQSRDFSNYPVSKISRSDAVRESSTTSQIESYGKFVATTKIDQDQNEFEESKFQPMGFAWPQHLFFKANEVVYIIDCDRALQTFVEMEINKKIEMNEHLVQSLLIPEIISLTQNEMPLFENLFKNHEAVFIQLGIMVEQLSPTEIRLMSLPCSKDYMDLELFFNLVIKKFKEDKTLEFDSLFELLIRGIRTTAKLVCKPSQLEDLSQKFIPYLSQEKYENRLWIRFSKEDMEGMFKLA